MGEKAMPRRRRSECRRSSVGELADEAALAECFPVDLWLP
jgi:hypothetical protein